MKFKALKAAFPYTIPILWGFLFLGFSYGLYMKSSGFSVIYPTVMALVIFGGSLEFVCVSMLLAPFAPVQTLLVAVMIQARHLFYGIAMLDKYKNVGAKKFYLIFGLCDETFSINCTAKIPEGVDKGWFYTFVTILNQCYWVTGAILGSLFGSIISFNLEGLDFVMTAMFVVIFLEQWLKEKKHYTAYIGLFCSIICLVIFGSESFLLPTMAAILAALTFLKKPIERGGFAQ